MSWSPLEDPVCHMCLAAAMLASRSLTQEITGLNPFTELTNIFVTEFPELNENI